MSTFATIALVVTAVAAVAGGVTAGVAAKQAGDAQEDAAKANAKIANNNAIAEAQAAAENAVRKRQDNQRQLSAIRAKMAGQGVQVGSGSALEVLGASASDLELQTQDMFRESQAKQAQYANQASSSLFEGKQAAAAGNWGMATSLIGAAGSAASGYSAYKDNTPQKATVVAKK